MAKDFIRTWDGRQLEDWGSVVSKEFKQFQGAMKREVKRLAEEQGATLVDWHNGHYDMTGVLERNGLYVYFSYSNLDRTKVVLTRKSTVGLGCTLMRTMKHAKDWTGGPNNNVEFEQFPETMARLFKEQERLNTDNQTNDSSTIKKETTMASKIQSRHFYVAITPYKLEGHQNEFNELQGLISYDDRGHAFDVTLHAGWGNGSWHGYELYGGQGWLTDAQWIYVKEAPRNSQKTIDQMYQNLTAPGRESNIRELFDRRDWDTLKAYIKEVALTGTYSGTINSEQPNEQTTNQPNNQNKNEETMNQEPRTMNQISAADLIGKTIIVGENIATIVIKSADGNTLQTEFKKADSPIGMPLPVTMENLRQQIESGAWRIAGCDNVNGNDNNNHEPLTLNPEPESQPSDISPQPSQKARVQPKPAQEIEEEPTEQPADNAQSSTLNDEDPFVAAYQAQKAVKPEHIVLFKYQQCFCAIMDDAQPVADACGTKPAVNNGYAFVLFKAEELPTVMPKLLRQGKQVNVVEAPEAEGTTAEDKPKVKPKAAQEIDDENDNVNVNVNENISHQTSDISHQTSAEPETKDAKPQPKSKPSDVTVEPEDGTPFIREAGKSIIVAGDTSKIEAVLLTMWGRKRPYTHKGKTYSGIQLSAKHRATVKEIIKLAS